MRTSSIYEKSPADFGRCPSFLRFRELRQLRWWERGYACGGCLSQSIGRNNLLNTSKKNMKFNLTFLVAAVALGGVFALPSTHAQTTVATDEAAVITGGAVVHSKSSSSVQSVGTVETRPTTVQSTSVMEGDEAVARGTTGTDSVASDPGTGSGAGLEREVTVVRPAATTQTSVTTALNPITTTGVSTEQTETTTTVVEEE